VYAQLVFQKKVKKSKTFQQMLNQRQAADRASCLSASLQKTLDAGLSGVIGAARRLDHKRRIHQDENNLNPHHHAQ
jgi:hypothetical protein